MRGAMKNRTHISLNLRSAALVFGLASAGFLHPAYAQDQAGQITLGSKVLEDSDENRFFLRTGGIARDDVSYKGLTPGQDYTLVAQLYNVGTGELTGKPVLAALTPEASEGSTSFMVPVPQNRTRFNIDYAVYLTLYDGAVDEESMHKAVALAEIRDTKSEDTVIQVHAVQRVTVTATDPVDHDRALPGAGGTIVAKVDYENLVEGYHYTLWGELMKPSGQSTGIYASIADYAPEGKNGTVTMEFTVPEGFEGMQLVPSIGLYHKKRVVLDQMGALTRIPDAPNPVMIASDPNMLVAEKTINIGVPFEEQMGM